MQVEIKAETFDEIYQRINKEYSHRFCNVYTRMRLIKIVCGACGKVRTTKLREIVQAYPFHDYTECTSCPLVLVCLSRGNIKKEYSLSEATCIVCQERTCREYR